MDIGEGVKGYIQAMMNLFEQAKEKQPNYYFYKWLLEKGRIRKTTKFTKKELKFIKDKMKQTGIEPEAKECYWFSQMMAVVDEFTYVEGFATSIIPTEHAWLEYKGKVLDGIWGSLDNNKSPDGYSAGTDCEYFGVEVPIELVFENVSKNEMAESILPLMFEKSRQNGDT